MLKALKKLKNPCNTPEAFVHGNKVYGIKEIQVQYRNTVVMDFRITRKARNILSQTTYFKNTQNNR